jgi:segregation and condensation protein A
VWSLLDAFAQVLSRAKVDLDHEVSFERMSITERIQQLCDRLSGRATCRFEELFDGQRTRFDLVITFMALLEMTRLKMTRVYQSDPLAEIFIELSTLDRSAIAHAVEPTAPVETPAPTIAPEASDPPKSELEDEPEA